MDERVIRFRVGVVVLAATIVTVILIVLLGAWPQWIQPQYSINVRFPSAPGVSVDTPVRKNGVLVGRVSGVELVDEGRGVLLTLRIERKYILHRWETARIGTGSLVTGDAVVEIVPRAQADLLREFDTNGDGTLDSDELAESQQAVADGEYIADGLVTRNPFEVLASLESEITIAFGSIESAGNRVGSLADNLNSLLADNEDQIQRIMGKTEVALDRFNTTMESLGDPQLQAGLKRTVTDLPQVFDELRQTLVDARETLTSFQKMSARAESNLANLEDFTRPLGERGEQLAANIDDSVRSLEELLAQMVQFSQGLNSSEGTLGRLVHDPDLYLRLERAASNVEDVSRRLRPIVDDVRVFTDKIARDPRQLGIKGALDRQPLGSGVKFAPR